MTDVRPLSLKEYISFTWVLFCFFLVFFFSGVEWGGGGGGGGVFHSNKRKVFSGYNTIFPISTLGDKGRQYSAKMRQALWIELMVAIVPPQSGVPIYTHIEATRRPSRVHGLVSVIIQHMK